MIASVDVAELTAHLRTLALLSTALHALAAVAMHKLTLSLRRGTVLAPRVYFALTRTLVLILAWNALVYGTVAINPVLFFDDPIHGIAITHHLLLLGWMLSWATCGATIVRAWWRGERLWGER